MICSLGLAAGGQAAGRGGRLGVTGGGGVQAVVEAFTEGRVERLPAAS